MTKRNHLCNTNEDIWQTFCQKQPCVLLHRLNKSIMDLIHLNGTIPLKRVTVDYAFCSLCDKTAMSKSLRIPTSLTLEEADLFWENRLPFSIFRQQKSVDCCEIDRETGYENGNKLDVNLTVGETMLCCQSEQMLKMQNNGCCASDIPEELLLDAPVYKDLLMTTNDKAETTNVLYSTMDSLFKQKKWHQPLCTIIHDNARNFFVNTFNDQLRPKLTSDLSSVIKKLQANIADNQPSSSKFVPFHSKLPDSSNHHLRKRSVVMNGTKRRPATPSLSPCRKMRKPVEIESNISLANGATGNTAVIQKPKIVSNTRRNIPTVGSQSKNGSLAVALVVERKPLKSILKHSFKMCPKENVLRVHINEKMNTLKWFEPCTNSFPLVRGQGAHLNDVQLSRDILKLPLKEQLIFYVVQWNPIWFNEYSGDSSHRLPPIIDKQQFKHGIVPFSFFGFHHYVDVVRPLYLCEIFERAYCTATLDKDCVKGLAIPVKDVIAYSCFHEFHVRAVVPRCCNDFTNETLVKFSLDDFPPHESNCFLGVIMFVTSQPVTRLTDVRNELREYVDLKKVTENNMLNFVLRCKAKSNLPRNYNGKISFRSILNLLPFISHVETLNHLQQHSPFSELIFSSPLNSIVYHSLNGGNMTSSYAKEHLSNCAASVFNEHNLSLYLFSVDTTENRSVCIFNLIELIQSEKIAKSLGRSAILILSSSDALLDAISRHIFQKNKLLKDCDKRNFANFVRIGEKEDMALDVWPFSLNMLLEINLKQAASSTAASTKEEESSVEINVSDMNTQIGHIRGQLASLDCAEFVDKTEKLDLENALRDLEKKLKTCTNQRAISKSLKYKQKCTIVFHSEVIAVSLKSMTSQPLLNILNDDKRPLKISCAIVTDSENMFELDALFPARFDIHKLVLFGSESEAQQDFIKSRAVKSCNMYSLFERLRKKVEKEQIKI